MFASKSGKKITEDGSFTKPFGLTASLKRPTIKLDLIPILDLLVIALFFGLLFTRFVMVPGVRVELPKSELQMSLSNLPVAVLTIGNGGMLFFDGAVFELNSIKRGFQKHHEEVLERDIVLLIKTEGSMDLQLFLELCHMAKDAGFVQVQIAGEHLPDTNSIVPSNKDKERNLTNGFLIDT